MLVYGECECFVMQMLYVCVLCASCGSSAYLLWMSSMSKWFLCVILHTMSSGKSLQLLCILIFGMLCLSAIL